MQSGLKRQSPRCMEPLRAISRDVPEKMIL